MFGKKKQMINAILDTDIEVLLKQTGQYEDLINEKLICKCCGTIISIENIGIIIPVNAGEKIYLEFFCESALCLQKYNCENGK
ncbi:hypothetical protein AQPE_0428 [Aquipluma nitroreducens]|uniref:Uncharacterized protein n=1 Tax=Aquipluma nitroreducens TaxID=2010828 RepID=A0A5K7S3Z6_9BACT|nr:hypothetical protein [Aquipluma nitroreducens]BBE16291.1 hypothetical protein AQPE_0428 [Aquipluma nitroreducens]